MVDLKPNYNGDEDGDRQHGDIGRHLRNGAVREQTGNNCARRESQHEGATKPEQRLGIPWFVCQHDRAKLIAAEQFSQQNLLLTRRSMPEMPVAGEGHGHVALVGGDDDLGVALGAARLYGRGRAGLGGGDEAVGERKKGIAAYHAAGEV